MEEVCSRWSWERWRRERQHEAHDYSRILEQHTTQSRPRPKQERGESGRVVVGKREGW